MSEFLVFCKTRTHTDPARDRRGCFKPGMVVDFHKNRHAWAALESKKTFLLAGNDVRDWPGDYCIFKVKHLKLRKCNRLACCQINTDEGLPTNYGSPFIQEDEIEYRKREFIIDFSLMKKIDLERLRRTSEIAMDVKAFEKLVVRCSSIGL